MSRVVYESGDIYVVAFSSGSRGPCLQLNLPEISRDREEVIELHAAIGQWIRETAPPPAPSLWRPGSDPLPPHESPESYRLMVVTSGGLHVRGSVCHDGDVLTSHGRIRERGDTIVWWMVLPPLPDEA